MAEYYVIEEPKPAPQDIKLKDILRRAAWLDDDVVKGAPYFDAAWVIKDIPRASKVSLHHHEFDEYLGFLGRRVQSTGDVVPWKSSRRRYIEVR